MGVSSELHRLLYRMAQAYYLEGQTQQEIAQRFGLSRPKVSRLLQRARDEQIVSITLVPPRGGAAELEAALERRFGLQEVVLVAASDPRDSGTVARELGPAAAECLLRCLSGTETVGLAWGRTVLGMVNALPQQAWPELTIVQISGGLGPVGVVEHSTEVARRAAQRLNARLRLIPAPGIVSTQAAAQVLRGDPQIAETLALARRADVAVVGLGIPSANSVLLRDGSILRLEDLDQLKAAGAVGDVALRYLDTWGDSVELEMNDRVIGLTLDEIREIPRVIGVAGGTDKVEVVRAALRGQVLDVLVSDEATARRLLEESGEG